MTDMYSRRAFLGSAVALGGVAVLSRVTHGARRQAPFFRAHNLPIGLQLYTLGPDPFKDLDGTLQAVADIGYRAVELSGYFNRSPIELRAALDRAGLVCRSSHVQARAPSGPTLQGDLAKLAADAHVLGVEYIVVSLFLMPERYTRPNTGENYLDFIIRVGNEMTVEDWIMNADFLNEKGAILKREGIKLGYQNHNVEFTHGESATPYELLLKNTDPGLVTFEMDAGWVAAAGFDPIPLLRAHRGRFSLMHVKDIKASTIPNTAFKMDPTEIGSGKMNWTAILPVAYQAGVRNFYIEQEPPFAGPRLNSARQSYNYIANLVA